MCFDKLEKNQTAIGPYDMMINITKDELVARVSNHNRGIVWSR